MNRTRANLRKQLQRLAALTAVAAVTANDPRVLKELEAALADGDDAAEVVEQRIGKRLKSVASCYNRLHAMIERLTRPSA